MATNRSWTGTDGKKQEATEFHNVVAWGKLADICGSYLGKGRKVYIEGRLQTHDWDGQDGVKRYRTEIICENMIILDRASGSSAPSTTSSPFSPSSTSPFTPPKAPIKDDPAPNPDDEIRIEDIPF